MGGNLRYFRARRLRSFSQRRQLSFTEIHVIGSSCSEPVRFRDRFWRLSATRFQSAFVKAGGSRSDFPAFANKTAVFVVNTVQAIMGVPVYLALGNDDSPCVDYGLAPGSAFLTALADSLDVLAHNPEAATDFRTAGFYELPHPTLANEEILVLNSVLWSPRYSNCGSNG